MQNILTNILPKPHEPYLFDTNRETNPAYHGIYRTLRDEYKARALNPDHDVFRK